MGVGGLGGGDGSLGVSRSAMGTDHWDLYAKLTPLIGSCL